MSTRSLKRQLRSTRRQGSVLVAFVVVVAVTAIGGIALATTSGTSQNLVVKCAPIADKPVTDENGVISCVSSSGSSTTSSTSSSTSSTSSSTTSSTTTLPPPAMCGAPTALSIVGDQGKSFTGSVPALKSLNATQASWHLVKVGDYAVSVFSANAGSCWQGGQILGDETNPLAATAPWTTYHYRAGYRFSQPNMTVERVESSYYGDAFKPKDDGGGHATAWLLRHVYSAHAYDDCIENDYLHGGRVEDSLLNCYVGYSARASSSQGDAPDGVVTFDRVLMRLDPQVNVYKGTSPGTGGWFKLNDTSPTMALHDSTFAAGQLPNHQDLKPPAKLSSCTGVTILWYGSGSFPEAAAWKSACPDVRIVTGDAAKAEWLTKVVAWLGS